MVKQPGLFSPKLWTMSSHFFTQSPQKISVGLGIHSLTSWDKFFMHNPLDVKESDDHALEIVFHLSGLFALVTWGFSTGRIVALSQGRNRIRSSHDPRQERFIVGGELTKFSADAYALLHLVSCQDPWHKFGCDTVHAQFFRQNTLASTITNVHLLSNVRNGPTSILANDLLNSCNGFRSCATCGSPGVSSSSTDVRPALNRACH